ncbi:morn repeat incomplete domain containing protein [Pandoravirus celtis]|uniref:Morn repeat incomplete domain containing protein n=1 Tax=Pandoravirus celtis TaxID=2568002 RepID=A0A4D6EJ79_9VIRU|nr:morn repeat incomplete domain containing protein [Pandoravirus celtis]
MSSPGPILLPSCPTMLPSELWWIVVDLLLAGPRGATEKARGVIYAARLGLTCHVLASMIIDDEDAWASRCRRDFGAERTGLHVEHARFGIRWMCLYGIMGLKIDGPRDGKWSPRCGVVSNLDSYTCGLFDGSMGTVYRLTVARPCPKSRGAVVTERGPHPDRPGVEWLSMRRVPPSIRGFLVLNQPKRGSDPFCACPACRFGVYGLGACVVAHLATYSGAWSDKLPHGYGRATFVNGLTYDGQWHKGLPHGRGALGGTARESIHGMFVARKRVCGCYIDGSVNCPCDGTTGGAWCYDGQVALDPDADHGLDLQGPEGRNIRKWWYIVMPSDPGNLDGCRCGGAILCPCPLVGPKSMPHGQGTATYRDGRTFVGTWRRGRRVRGCWTLPDGTTFTGRIHSAQDHYGVQAHQGVGQVKWPSGATTECMLWDSTDRLWASSCRPACGRDPHANPLCACDDPPACRPGARQTTIRMHNGDICVMQWNAKEGDLESIRSFRFSPDCADPALAGTIIAGCDWVCLAVPRAQPRRPYCPDDSIYWPSDALSDAAVRFAAYVREGRIGWDEEAVAFWHSVQAARQFVVNALSAHVRD